MDKSDESFVAMAGSVEPPKMPSADLINFRFDQSDKQMSEVNRKLDHLTNNFATKTVVEEKLIEIRRDLETHAKTVGELKTRSDQQDGALISLRVAIGLLTALSAIIGGLWWIKG